MVPGLWLTEGGQSATGALIDHVILSHAQGAELLAKVIRINDTDPANPRLTLENIDGAKITTVRDLVGRSEDELLTVRNFGETTLDEVRERLESLGLRLGMKVATSSPS